MKKRSKIKRHDLRKSKPSFSKETLLHKKPYEVALTGNIWTGTLMCQYLQNTFGITYRSGIYDLLERLGLTHQKAHADYGNAQPAAQEAFVAELETVVLQADATSSVVFFDEFSVCEKPTSYYGWAEKNTRPTFKTNEKKLPG